MIFLKPFSAQVSSAFHSKDVNCWLWNISDSTVSWLMPDVALMEWPNWLETDLSKLVTHNGENSPFLSCDEPFSGWTEVGVGTEGTQGGAMPPKAAGPGYHGECLGQAWPLSILNLSYTSWVAWLWACSFAEARLRKTRLMDETCGRRERWESKRDTREGKKEEETMWL